MTYFENVKIINFQKIMKANLYILVIFKMEFKQIYKHSQSGIGDFEQIIESCKHSYI